MPFVIPKALRNRLSSRRFADTSLRPSPAAQSIAQATRVLGRIAKSYAAPTSFHLHKSHATLFADGLDTEEQPELGTLRRKAHALLASLTLEGIASADLDALGAAEGCLARFAHKDTLTGAILVSRGLRDATHAIIDAARYDVSPGPMGYWSAMHVVVRDPTSAAGGWQGGNEPCRELRDALCAANDSDYQACVAIARDLRESTPDTEVRATAAYAFPEEPWAAADLREWQLRAPAYLLTSITEVAIAREHFKAGGHWAVASFALDLARNLPEDEVVPLLVEVMNALLVKPADVPIMKTPPREIAQALACFRTHAAAAALAPHAASPILGPIVLAYFHDAPELGEHLVGSTRGRAKGVFAKQVERVLTATEPSAPAEVARDEDVPALLCTRPWRAPKSKKSATPSEADAVMALEYLGTELERVVVGADWPVRPEVRFDVEPIPPDELAVWREVVKTGGYTQLDFKLERVSRSGSSVLSYVYKAIPAADALWAWNEHYAGLTAGPRLLVATHGLAVIPGFRRRPWIDDLAYEGGDDTFAAAAALVSPRMAPSMARIAARRKKRRDQALRWLTTYPDVAVHGLVPDALGPLGEARTDARAALEWMAQKGHAALVRDVAARYGEGASRAIGAMLDRDPLAIGVGVPKRADFLRDGDLPPVRLRRSGSVLGEEARANLLELLQIAPLDPPYAGIALVREACTEESLGAFAVELLERWSIAGAPGKHEWMLFAVAHFPSKAGTRRVASMAREAARKDAAKATRACSVLARLATGASDTAFMELASIADTTRFEAVRRDVKAMLVDAAEARGLTPAELEDRSIPDLGLGADGTMTLSYGARAFVVRFDELMRPLVREKCDDGKGPLLKTLPRAAKTDDAALAKEARARFEALRSDAQRVATCEIRRLERAMTEERSWPYADFSKLARHPLLMHLVKRLVWEACSDAAPPRQFRVAEDGTLADVAEKALVLADDSRVRLAHPAREPAMTEWARVFGDYEIAQPFEQLARRVSRASDETSAAAMLSCAKGLGADGKKLLGFFEARGWRRSDSYFIAAWLRDVRTRNGPLWTARVTVTPGIEMALLDVEQTIGDATLETDTKAASSAFTSLCPVAFSELVRDLESFRDSR